MPLEDTGEELLQLSKLLGFPTVNALLGSKDFEDIIEADFTEDAIGASNKSGEKVLCYKIRPMARTCHLLTMMEDTEASLEERKNNYIRKQKTKMGDPAFATNIVEGKKILLTLLDQLGAHNEAVDMMLLKTTYFHQYGVELDKKVAVC
uniref:DUF7516 domain-containing protein n=1 Tax=Ditylenchus dipsaci TaxID=166011 RepID=A0A915DIZ1_9BILA